MKRRINPWLVFAVFALAVAALVFFLVIEFPEAVAGRDGQVDLTKSLLVLTFVGASLFARRQLPVGHMLRYALICTVSSVLGALLGYVIGTFLYETIGQPILAFYGKENAFEQVTKSRTASLAWRFSQSASTATTISPSASSNWSR